MSEGDVDNIQPKPNSKHISHLYGAITRVISVLLLGIIIGTIGSFLAITFVESITWISNQLNTLTKQHQSNFNLVILLTPIIGGLLVGGLIRLTSRQQPTTLANLVYWAQIHEKGFTLRDGAINALASIISLSSGASVGQYGPLATMGATIGGQISRWFRTDTNLGIGCGVAAAIATAFSAPIAAILFAHEVVLRHYSLRAFAPITIASSTGFFINTYLLGRPPLFPIIADRSVFAPEFFAFVLIGVIGALVAILYMKSVLIMINFATRTQFPTWLRPAVAGLGIGLIGQWLPEVMNVGLQIFERIITDGYYTPSTLLLLIIAKIFATALCIGFGFAGGVFHPALVIGLLLGALLGQGAEQLYGDSASGLAFYALCGMAAVTSPVIGGPLTAILIVFELTRNYELTTAVMVSVAFSNVVSYRLFGRSLFDRQLFNQGYDLSQGRDRVILQRTTIATVVTTDAVVLSSDKTTLDAKHAMLENERQECYVIDDLSKFVGKLSLSDSLHPTSTHTHKTLAEQLATHKPTLTLQHDISVWDALEKMRGFIGESIPIIDRRGFYIGVIYQSALAQTYLNLSEGLRAEEHAAN